MRWGWSGLADVVAAVLAALRHLWEAACQRRSWRVSPGSPVWRGGKYLIEDGSLNGWRKLDLHWKASEGGTQWHLFALTRQWAGLWHRCVRALEWGSGTSFRRRSGVTPEAPVFREKQRELSQSWRTESLRLLTLPLARILLACRSFSLGCFRGTMGPWAGLQLPSSVWIAVCRNASLAGPCLWAFSVIRYLQSWRNLVWCHQTVTCLIGQLGASQTAVI